MLDYILSSMPVELSVFTARCTLVQSAVRYCDRMSSSCLSVCLSVYDVGEL